MGLRTVMSHTNHFGIGYLQENVKLVCKEKGNTEIKDGKRKFKNLVDIFE